MSTADDALEKVILLNQEGKHKEAIEYLSGIEANSNINSPDLYAEMGLAYYRLGDKEKSLAAVDKALALDHSNVKANHFKGNLLYYEQHYDDAIKVFKQAIKADPNYYYAFYGLGNVFNALNKNQEAAEHYEKAIQLKPDFAYAYISLGIVYGKQLKYDSAIDKFNKALELDPKSFYAYYNRANSYYYLNKYEEALADYKKFLRYVTKDSSSYVSNAKEKIEELKKSIKVKEYGEVKKVVEGIKEFLFFQDECITHYTGLSVAKTLILDGSKFRLSEGAYLNDTSEGREVFNFLSFQLDNSNDNDTIAEEFARKPFIGSFVSDTKHDDLTLWRMYGKEAKEEAKGCAITLNREQFINSINEELARNKQYSPALSTTEELKFFRVAYLKKDGDGVFIVPGSDKPVEILNALMCDLKSKVKAYIKKRRKVSDFQDLRELLNEIAYLIKSADYENEHELRLVIKGTMFQKKINKDSSPPRVYIELMEINRLIRKVTFGPKVERADEWASAFFYNLSEQNNLPKILISHLPFK